MTRSTYDEDPIGWRFRVRAEAADHLVNSIAQLTHDAVAGYRRWRLAQQTRKDLERLPDRLLSDIGIARGEIDGLAQSLAAQEVDGARAGETDSKRQASRHAGNPALVGCG